MRSLVLADRRPELVVGQVTRHVHLLRYFRVVLVEGVGKLHVPDRPVALVPQLGDVQNTKPVNVDARPEPARARKEGVFFFY